MEVDTDSGAFKEHTSDATTESLVGDSMIVGSSTGERSPAPTELDSPSDADANSLCVHDSESEIEIETRALKGELAADTCSQLYNDISKDIELNSCQTEQACCTHASSDSHSCLLPQATSTLEELVLKDSTNFDDTQGSAQSRESKSLYSRNIGVQRAPSFDSQHSVNDVFGAVSSLSKKAMSSSTLATSAPLKRKQKRRPESESQQAYPSQRRPASAQQPIAMEPPHQLSRPKGGLIELRQERRKREQEFRLGLLEAKAPVIHLDCSRRDWCTLELSRSKLEPPNAPPLQVLFPLEATNSQRVMAQCAVDALDQSGSALLEAPTGTGKTLAMLGTSLAWQLSEVNRIHKEQLANPASSNRPRKIADDRNGTNPSPPEPPRVIWVARTHEQLLHAVHEFRKLPYRPIMSLRLSRERFCMLPIVRNSRNKAEACELATTIAPMKARQGVKQGNRTPQPAGCSYLEHAEAIHYPQATRHRRRYELGGPLAVYDIEDLVKEAQSLHICPFHAVGDIAMEGAGLIFMTYNQMLDPLVRFAGGYEPLFKDAIVIVDEAHNLTAETREVASFVATAQQLEEMRCHFEELALQLAGAQFPKIARRLVVAVSKLREWLLLASSSGPNSAGVIKLQPSSFGDKGTLVADGLQCLSLVKHCGLGSVEQIDRDIQDLKLLRKDLIWAGLESTAVRSGAVNELESFLWKMRFVLGGSEDYRLVVESGPKVHFICLRGAVSFAPAVRLARSLLLMSGTLSPFDVIQHELGLNPNCSGPLLTQNVLTCQAPHHAGLNRMCRAIAVASAGKVVFDSRLKQRSDMYLDAIGFAVISLCEVIPNGTVVFLPSYSLLDALVLHLRNTGCLSDLESRRRVFIEQRGEGGNAIITNYRNAARAGSAVLFAVMRGKAAEGIDLRDAEARGCLVVGVPFPQLAIEVQLRRQAPGGNRWYEAEAMRQVSQAAGRLLRHQHDFGAIVLLDVRYTAQDKTLQMLAPWLRSLLQTCSLDMTRSALQSFFVEHLAR